MLNIGGIANISCPAGEQAEVTGFDSGPGNTLMDRWTERHLGTSDMDRDGAMGEHEVSVDESAARTTVLAIPILLEARSPKSTGREHFNLRWLERHSPR